LLDSIYGQVMRVRRRRYERQPELQRRLSRPVISVGNLSTGGTGKSPVCAAIAVYLTVIREHPAILSRGYKREDPVDGVVSVNALNVGEFAKTLAQVGDEPMMLARASSATVFVSPDRYLAGRLAEARGHTVHLLDDGFQHLQLARDLDILVTTVGEIANGRVIPFGRLREPADAAARADVLIVSDATAEAAAAEASLLGIERSCGMTRSLSDPIGLQDRWAAAPSRDAKILAVAGIANPERFVVSLQQAGWNVVDLVRFPDHHRYAASDLRHIAGRLTASGADAVYTTAKDSVRFEAIEPAPFPLYRVNLLVNFDPAHVPYDAVKAVLQ
jgi:tetraacyldisaccharide 4'-kinase